MYIYEDIIWFIENTALIFFMRLACTYFVSKKYESIVVIRRSCSILARSHERICHPGKSNFSHVTGGLITATISVNVGKALIHSSDFTEWQKERIFQGLLRSIAFFILIESDSSAEFLGALRFNSADRMASKIQCMTARNNMCIKALLITSIYSIVTLLFTSIGIFTYAENLFYMQFY